MDWDQHLREAAAHLVWMASFPMALEHAKFREQELMRSPMYADLPQYVREARLSASSSPSAPAPASTPASTGARGPAG